MSAVLLPKSPSCWRVLDRLSTTTALALFCGAGATALVAATGPAFAQAISATNGAQVTVPSVSFPATTYSTGAFAQNGYILFSTGVNAGTPSRITGSGLTMTTGGDRAFVGRVEQNGEIVLNTSSLTTTGSLANALSADIGTITGTNLTIVTRGPTSSGAVAANGSTIALTGGTIDTFNTNSLGLNSATGSTVTASDVTITTRGAGSSGVVANSGFIGFMRGSVTTQGNNAVGFQATNGGTIQTIGPLTVLTRGANSHGVRADSGGSVDIGAGASITINGTDALGLFATDAGSTIRAANATILVTNFGGFAVGAEAGATITVTDSVATSINSALRVGPGGTINATNVVATATGNNALGVFANAGTINMTGGSVTALNGGGDHGFNASNAAIINADGVVVNASGNGINLSPGARATFRNGTIDSVGSGVNVRVASTAEVSNSVITTTGDNGFGLHAMNPGSSIKAVGISVTTSGANAHGAVVEDNAVLSLANSTLTANGGGATGLSAIGPAGSIQTATLNQVTLASPQGASIAVDGGTANVAFNNSTAVINNGLWLNVATSDAANPTVANITVDPSIIKGAALTDALSTSNVSLLAGSLWTMTGNSNVTSLANDASTINYTAPVGDPTQLSSYKTLTAVNYAGQGGRLGLNTFLAADSSPSDRLVIDSGTASGTSTLLIKNAGGLGDVTTANGILVVDAVNGGTTTPGAFALGAPAVAGPYEYTLFRASVDASGPENWYLRSTLDCTLAPTLPACLQPPVPQPPAPHYRQEVSLYTAMPVLVATYGRGLIDTLHERMGGDAQLLSPGRDHQPDGAWGRVIGQWGHREGDAVGIYGSDGPAFDYSYGALQFGLDLHRKDFDDGKRDNAGVYFALGRASADVEHSLLGTSIPAGTDDFTAFSIGGYWTRFGANNWYLDGVVQATWYDMEMSANRGLQPGDTDGFGLAASLEGGYPFDLGNNWLLEPQAQLVYQAINISGFNDGAANVSYSDTDSLAGRVGARLSRSWDIAGSGSSAPRKLTLWGRADIWHEFLGDPTTEFSSATGPIPFTADLGGTWGKLGLGGAMQLSDVTTLYGNVNYEAAFNGGDHAWEGKAGLKVKW